MHGVGVDAVGEVGADGAFFGFLGIGGAHQLAVAQDGVFTFQHLHHDGAGDHEGDQVLEEGALLVDGVEGFGFGLGELHHAGSDDFQAGGFEAGEDLADDILGHGIGFDDGQGSFDSHG